MNNGLGFSEREIEIIKKRYPIVDIENPDIPPVGLSTISSLDYLESAVRFDIANMNESSDLSDDLISIIEKIGIYRKMH
ncbi:MAG: hypothetical protein IKD94_06660 [Erysipelotrichaceae bacterium]|nr:hypothetical protein [Erysipelotrichaceae bacterium]